MADEVKTFHSQSEMMAEWVKEHKRRQLENPDRLPPGTYVLVDEHNHEWVSKVTGIPFSDVGKEYAKAKELGFVCVLEARRVEPTKPTDPINLADHPQGHTAFISRDGNVINMGGENYYRSCLEMVSQHQGCVKRVGHVTEHEDYYGNKMSRN